MTIAGQGLNVEQKTDDFASVRSGNPIALVLIFLNVGVNLLNSTLTGISAELSFYT